LLAFVSPGTLSSLQIENAGLDDSTFLRVAHRRLPPPLDPSSSSGSGRSDPPVEQPVPRVLHPGGREQTQESIPIEDVCLGVANGIMTSHIVFPILPKGVEDWDIVRYFLSRLFLIFLLKAS
jgi:peroxin-1